MAKIRVLVVDDSAFMRKVVSDILSAEPGIEVVGKARDGQDALEKIAELRPDVVTMDVEMPVMDGITALDRIMRTSPLPVIMLSSLTSKGAELTMRALELGAVDFIPKPSGQISLDLGTSKDDIVNKVKIAAGTRSHLKALPSSSIIKPEPPKPAPAPAAVGRALNKLVLIGTSTGGPKALHEVIPKLPGNLDAAVLIVQHMPPGFTKSLAERLDQISAIRVKEAEQGERILPGWAYVAPGDHHMKVVSGPDRIRRELYIKLDQSEPRHGCRPAVDPMLESVAEHFWSEMVCVIMTGMGHDGAAGMLKVRAKKAKTIAEHQSTCVVYGMPKTAVETGQVDRIVPLQSISNTIMQLL